MSDESAPKKRKARKFNPDAERTLFEEVAKASGTKQVSALLIEQIVELRRLNHNIERLIRATKKAAKPKTTLDAPTQSGCLTVLYPAHRKIPVIKAVRHVTGLGIKEAKDIAEGTLNYHATQSQIEALNQYFSGPPGVIDSYAGCTARLTQNCESRAL